MTHSPTNADKHNPRIVNSTTKTASLRSVNLEAFLKVRLDIDIVDAPRRPHVRNASCAAAVHVFELTKKSSNSEELKIF